MADHRKSWDQEKKKVQVQTQWRAKGDMVDELTVEGREGYENENGNGNQKENQQPKTCTRQ